jgi:predicted metal-dependent HD superfamily phosphohydrolase
MVPQLKSQWINLSSKYFEDQTQIESYWEEIKTEYTDKNRYYHNLYHLQNMFSQLNAYKDDILDLDTLKFAIWYHDIIYKSTKKDNEDKSVILAKTRLQSSKLDENRLEKVQKLIISTKNHKRILNENNDNAYFLDLDLSILGTDWMIYEKYIHNIRKEYKVYPNFMYNPARKKVLHHFLERDTLFFTEAFKTKFEKQARENLKKEIEQL